MCCRALPALAMPPATASIPSPCPLLSPEALGVEEAELQGLCQLPVHQAVPQEGSAPAHGGLQLGGEGVIQPCHASLPPTRLPHSPCRAEGGPQGWGWGAVGTPEGRKPFIALVGESLVPK